MEFPAVLKEFLKTKPLGRGGRKWEIPLAHQNRTIAIASDFRVDGAKSPEIPQKEEVLDPEIAARNRKSLAAFHRTLKSQCSIAFSCLRNRAISGVRDGHRNRKNRCNFGSKMGNSRKWLGEGAKGVLDPGGKGLPRVSCTFRNLFCTGATQFCTNARGFPLPRPERPSAPSRKLFWEFPIFAWFAILGEARLTPSLFKLLKVGCVIAQAFFCHGASAISLKSKAVQRNLA